MRGSRPSIEICADRQRFDEAQVLIDDCDAGITRLRGRIEHDPLAGNFDDTFVVRMDAAEDLDQRGFARAVFAQQRVDFSGQDFEIDAAQRLYAAKPLVTPATRINGVRGDEASATGSLIWLVSFVAQRNSICVCRDAP